MSARRKKIKVSHSRLAEKLLHLDGAPFSLKDYPHMRYVYDVNTHRLILKTSRQISKSTTLANLIVTNCIIRPNTRILYISPRIDQTKVFSRDRLWQVMSSPFVKKRFISSSDVQNVFYRQFNNGSKVYLRYALLTSEALRGYSTDINIFDETQGLMEAVIGVANETMHRSLIKKEIYAGTPQRTQGTLAKLWYQSSRNEWAVKCPHCNKWNAPLGIENIADWGLMCYKCNKELDPKNGTWVTSTNNSDSIGFRVSALQFYKAPWVNWKRDVVEKRKFIGEALFYNEVLGLEYDDGVSPITEEDIRKVCTKEVPIDYQLYKPEIRSMGIDYGPINSNDSFTYACLGRWNSDGRFQYLWFKKYYGAMANPSYYHKDVINIFKQSGAFIIGADYGLGIASNSEIREKIGYDRLNQYFYSDTQRARTSYNPKMPGYTINKNQIITEFTQAVKNGDILFPRWDDMSEHVRDFTNLAIKYNEEKNRQKYTKIGPDDALHAAIYCWLAAQTIKNF